MVIAELSPSADGDCEMQSKATEKLLISGSCVQTTVSRAEMNLQKVLHLCVVYLWPDCHHVSGIASNDRGETPLTEVHWLSCCCYL